MNSNDYDIVINEPFAVEELESIYSDIINDENNISKYFNEKKFNIFIFNFESLNDVNIKKIVIYVVKIYLKFYKVNSHVLMFNILDFIINSAIIKELTEEVQSIIFDVIETYDLLITTGHHSKLARFVFLKLRSMIQNEICNVVKLNEFLKKYSKILWKHEKKNAIVLLKNISEKLIIEKEEKLLLFSEAVTILLSVDNLKLNAGSMWSKNVSLFLCNALKDKSIAKSDIPLNIVMGTVNVMLKTLGLSWLPSTNEKCHYHSETFLQAFSVIFGTVIAVFSSTREDVEETSKVIALKQFAESLEILLSYLSVINGDSDQEFNSNEEKLLLFILSKVSQYEIEIERIVCDNQQPINELFFIYLRSLWIANALLGKDGEGFMVTISPALNNIVTKFDATLNDDMTLLNATDSVVFNGVCTDIINIIEDVIKAEQLIKIPKFMHAILLNLVNAFYNGFLYCAKSEKMNDAFNVGLLNILNLLTTLIYTMDDTEFLKKVDEFALLMLDKREYVTNKSVRLAMVNMFLEFFTHPQSESSFKGEYLVELLVWASKENEDNKSMENNFSLKLDLFFEKYRHLRTIFLEKLQVRK